VAMHAHVANQHLTKVLKAGVVNNNKIQAVPHNLAGRHMVTAHMLCHPWQPSWSDQIGAIKR
jgi:hypothetical protein